MMLNTVVAGVGGHGVVLAARVIALAAMKAGLEVKTAETTGMAQRGGAVIAHVRAGSGLWGPLIPGGTADILLGLEPAETLRALPLLKPSGTVIASTSPVVPVTVTLGLSSYDTGAIIGFLQEKADKIFLLDMLKLARRAGSPRAISAVALGALSALAGLPFTTQDLQGALLKSIKEKHREINLRAFEIGRRSMEVCEDGHRP